MVGEHLSQIASVMDLNMLSSPSSTPSSNTSTEDDAPVCILIFNSGDPSGAGGLSADITTIACVGGHPLPVCTGAYARDTRRIYDYFALDDEAVAEQARAVLEDSPVGAIKVGFVGSPGNLAAVSRVSSDYPDIPVISYMPDLSWWDENDQERYLDAFKELVLPQTSVLVGNHRTLWNWLLPDWNQSRNPSARDIAIAAEALEVPYVLVTGIQLPDQYVENVLATAQSVLGSSKYELFDASFTGAGDTLSAALTALLASGNDLGLATQEALEYLDHCLDSGFKPGMGHYVPDRLFWAQPDEDDEANEGEQENGDAPEAQASSDKDTTDAAQSLAIQIEPHETKH